jgi:hypothetical protein
MRAYEGKPNMEDYEMNIEKSVIQLLQRHRNASAVCQRS